MCVSSVYLELLDVLRVFVLGETDVKWHLHVKVYIHIVNVRVRLPKVYIHILNVQVNHQHPVDGEESIGLMLEKAEQKDNLRPKRRRPLVARRWD